MPYLTLYVLLGLCIALLTLAGHRLYRQRKEQLRHNGTLHRSRRFLRRSHH